MSNNVNLIAVCSFVAGNNLPMHFRRNEQPAEAAETVTQPSNEASEAVEAKTKTGPCIYRRLIQRVAAVGILALVLGLWCRQRHGEAEDN